MEYTLIRSKRKTISLRITEDARLEVRAPLKLSMTYIDRFIQSREQWIVENLAGREEKNAKKTAFVLCYGDCVTLCGKEYPIRAKEGKHAGFDGSCFYLPPGLPSDAVKRTVIHIYQITAKRILTEKTVQYAARMNVRPAAIKINSAKTRWGSCSGQNSINFSWRLVMADEKAVDYVVVHELAHILEHNHSPQFWAVVAAVFQDYRERKAALKKLQDRLSREDWE